MALSFKSRVEALVGDTSSLGSALDQWLSDEAKRLYNLIRNPERYASDYSDTGTGVAITGNRIVSVDKAGVNAVEIPYSDRYKYSDSNSIFYSNSGNPKYYITNGKLYVIPSGGNVSLLPYPAVTGASTSLPITEAEDALVLGTSMRVLIAFIDSDIRSLGNLTMDVLEPPVPPSAPEFVYNDAAVVVLNPSSTTLTTWDNQPFNWSSAVLNSPTITVNSSLPLYDKVPSPLNFSNLEKYISVEEDGAKAEVEAAQQRLKAEVFQSELYNSLNKFNQEAKAYELELQKASANASLIQQALISDADRVSNVEVANRAKDLEKQIAEYRSKLEVYANSVQAYIGSVNKVVQKFASDIQKKVQKIASYTELFKLLSQQYADAIKILNGV